MCKLNMNSWLNEPGVEGGMGLLVERVLVEVESENRGGGKNEGGLWNTWEPHGHVDGRDHGQNLEIGRQSINPPPDSPCTEFRALYRDSVPALSLVAKVSRP